MQSIEFYRSEFLSYLKEYTIDKEPVNLYEPVNYILNLGGKRLRPVLTLLSAELFGGDYRKALNAALAIEVFHNFSLVHDDIMDDAPLRRGKTTVHEKWNVNTGILSGDAMLISAYRVLEGYEPLIFQKLSRLFSETALKVCEGQQYDIDFETREDVTIPEYLQMIEYKTAVLIGAALQMGAITAGQPENVQSDIYRFGLHLGIAFQLQDDYLDAFGNPETFGKQIGGDIIENKKTYLYLKTLEGGTDIQKKELLDLYSIQPVDPTAKIQTIKELFVECGSADATSEAIREYSNSAFAILEKLPVSKEKKDVLRQFGESLMVRKV
ncbi:polyprenyl synthetase family protein [Euzebyella marina]|uniref:Polyprenyl synthetase family protein n=1 Tax=Euzebyella marina TaxID=1761453 RepID=A0A3G2L1X9_9FLAO|nr:polyprenyl synthetase family protein [Euzebyella marina]AYN66274.1 polyprenyl synthetase family protein [Euzebyella marina]